MKRFRQFVMIFLALFYTNLSFSQLISTSFFSDVGYQMSPSFFNSGGIDYDLNSWDSIQLSFVDPDSSYVHLTNGSLNGHFQNGRINEIRIIAQNLDPLNPLSLRLYGFNSEMLEIPLATPFIIDTLIYNVQANFPVDGFEVSAKNGIVYEATIDYSYDFFMNADTICPGENIMVDFQGNSPTVDWDWGDGTPNTYNQWNAEHMYPDTGTFTISCTYYDSIPHVISKTIVVDNGVSPMVEFWTKSGDLACPGDPVIFEASKNYASYQWDFGDGSQLILNEKQVAHVFPAINSYNVTLTATNLCGNSASYTSAITVDNNLPANASFWIDNMDPCPYDPVRFEPNNSGTFYWDFGDGETAFDPVPTHAFKDTGAYEITLINQNGCNDVDTFTQILNVMLHPERGDYGNVMVSFKTDGNNPEVAYLSVCPGTQVAFANHSYIPEGAKFYWDFGDGSPFSKEFEPVHVYDSIGYINPRFVVTNNCGFQDEFFLSLDVVDSLMPMTQLMSVPQNICPGEEVLFWDEEFAPFKNYEYNIDFGDSTSSGSIFSVEPQEPHVLARHIYNTPNVYHAIMEVQNACGNSIIDTMVISVIEDTLRVPFYYVDNTTKNHDMIEDWSQPHSTTDHVFTVPYNWSQSDTSLNDNFYVYFWYGGVYPDTLEVPEPDGMVKMNGNGNTATAYVPLNEHFSTIGVGVVWNCTGEPNNDPSAFGLPLDTAMMQINEFPIIDHGNTATPMVELNMWDGNCWPNYQNLEGTYETADLGGYFYTIDFWQYEGKYEISKKFPDGKVNFIERGWYSSYDSIIFFDVDYNEPMNVCQSSIEYTASMLNGQLVFMDSGDNCMVRDSALTSGAFHRLMNDFNKEGACPGDPVYFQAIGGVDFNWDFGDEVLNGNIVSKTFTTVGQHSVNLYASNACGRIDTLYSYVNIADDILPPAWFNVSSEYVFVDEVVQFWSENDRPGSEVFNYAWNFGDGMSGQGKTTEHIFQFPGEYDISLEVTNGCGTSMPEHRKVFVMDRPTCKAQFDYFYDQVKDTVFFYNTSLGDLNDGNWQFGDGTQSPNLNPAHQYTGPGVYNVCLTVRDTVNNCIDTYCEDIFVGQVDCYADYIFFVNNQTNEVSFTDASTGALTNWNWDFGDGYFSNMQNPIHQYAPGYYTVCLSVFNDATGCQDYKCFDISVGEQACFPEFTSYVDGLTVEFQSQSTGATSHYWDFGDGFFSEEKNPIHTYEAPGFYSIYYSIYNDTTQCFGEMFRDIEVIDSTGTIVNCQASFSQFIEADSNKVSFINESIGNITNVYWTFGDNSYSTEFDPIKVYDAPGTYQVCLSIRDTANNCQDEVCSDIFVESTAIACNADFGFVKDSLPGQFKFIDNSTGEITNYSWNFGDNTFANVQNPVHQFPSPGYYMVNLSILDSTTGCFDDITKEVYIQAPDSVIACRADFSFFIDPVNLVVNFSDRAQGNISNWYWTFGDGNYDETQNPVHSYGFAGEYTITQYVFDELSGCSDQKTETIKIGQSACDLTADIGYIVDTETKTVSFTDKSLGTRNIYYWTFGDGKTSDMQNPEHTYTNAGFYLITFNVIDSITGCDDHTSAFIQIGSSDCKAEYEYTVNVDSLKVSFINHSEANHFNYWGFGDGNFSESTEPIHYYKNPGKYHTGLVIGDETGICWDFTEEKIQVGEIKCDASFTTTVNPATLAVKFTNEDQVRSTNLYWQFGNGSMSTVPNPTYQYSYPGYYFVSLNTFNATNNCMDYYEDVILVGSEGDDCEADFYHQANATTREVQFTDNSHGEITQYLWDFGDESTSTEANPTHTYVDPGYKYVCLTVINSNNIPNMTCKDVNVGEGCLAQFDFIVDSMSVSFQDNSYGDPTEWRWDFGDETALNNEQNPTHTYATPGDYMVDFGVKNQNGCRNRAVTIISVGNESDTTFSVNFAYEVDTTGSKPSGYPVDMFGTGKGDAPSAKWNFGDKQKTGYAENSTTLRPTYTYTEPGTYDVCLTVEDPVSGKTATACKSIKVGETSSVNDIADYAEMQVYPNPAKDVTKLSYTLTKNMDLKVVLYDAAGQKVREILNESKIAGTYTRDIDLSTLASGTYFIEIQSSIGKMSKQLILRK